MNAEARTRTPAGAVPERGAPHDDMTKREIANLCCRVLAIYALMQAVPLAPYILWALTTLTSFGGLSTDQVQHMVVGSAYPAAMLVVTIVLWRKSGVIAAWMVGHDLQDHPHEPDATWHRATASEMHAIAFSVVGLWLLADAVPASLVALADVLMTPVASDPFSTPSPITYASRSLIESILRLIIGVWLLFGAPGLVRLLRRMRDFGLEERERPDYADRHDSGEKH